MLLAELQNKFESRIDRDGVRDVLMIANERDGGCPFLCIGCGVHKEISIVSLKENEEIIIEQIESFSRRLQENQEFYNKGYHIYFFNNGSLANPQELHRSNLELLLNRVSQLSPPPAFISMETRGAFVSLNLLKFLKAQNLNYNVHLNMGIESLTGNTGIYGKGKVADEVRGTFARLESFNKENGTSFGLDANFTFLPEFYSTDRSDEEAVRVGFRNDLKTFIDSYCGNLTPTRINIHPYYEIDSLPYKSAAAQFHILVEVAREMADYIIEKDFSEEARPSIFIGVNDSGYETPEWVESIYSWKGVIDEINAGE